MSVFAAKNMYRTAVRTAATAAKAATSYLWWTTESIRWQTTAISAGFRHRPEKTGKSVTAMEKRAATLF